MPATGPDEGSKNSANKTNHSAAMQRFLSSMAMSYDRWHDGIGYDLDAIDEMTEEEKDMVVDVLAKESSQPWSNFEALQHIHTRRALAAIREALDHGLLQTRIAASRFAEGSDREREAVLVEAIAKAEMYSGFTLALDQVENFHPPKIIEAMLRALLARGDEEAVNIAGMLFYVYGRAQSTFDWKDRPLFLKFKTSDPVQRKCAFEELCSQIGVDPAAYLGSS